MSTSRPISIGPLRIAAAYIGTVVGAGFASGQEVLRFFSAYGLAGFAGILIAAALFFFIGYSILLLGRSLRARSHVDIVRHSNGKLPGAAIDIIITLFMFGGLCTMIAGSGAIFHEQYGLPPVWGTVVMAAAALATVMTGTKGVLGANSYIVPFLMVSVLLIAAVTLFRNPVTANELMTSGAISGATPHWLLSAVNYASYNIVVSIGVLAPIGAAAADKKTLFRGALLGTAGLGAGMAAISLCLLTNMDAASDAQIPMLIIARRILPVIRVLFPVVLLSAVYTTAVGNLYGFVRRMPQGLPKPMVIAVTAAAALVVGQLGFSNMVKYLYPVVGYGGMLFFAGIIHVWIAKRDSLR